MAGVGEPLPLNRAQSHAMLPYNNTIVSSHEPAAAAADHHQLHFQLTHGIKDERSPTPGTISTQYSHYAMVYSNDDGNIAFETSPSLADSVNVLFTPELQERFAQIVSFRTPTISMLPGPDRTRRMSTFPGARGRTRHGMPWSPINGNSASLIHWQLSQNRHQRQHGRRRGVGYPYAITDQGGDALTLPPSGCVIRVDDEQRLKKYYEKAFEAFQQLNCRIIAKAFIKLVEPRKQVNYPYNGRRSSPGADPEIQPDPEMTKPPWWPAGVKHKEPDHLLKGERIKLLVHLLRNLGHSHDITAEKLREAGQDVRRSISPPERLQILDEVYSVRHMEERYLRGDISADVLIPIAQVHLTGPEFDTDAMSPEDSTSRVGDDSWMAGSYSSSSEGRRDSTRTPDSHVPFNNHNPMGQSQQFSLTLPNSPNTSSTPASSFDSSTTYSPREYTSSAASSVMSQEPSSHPVGTLHQPQRPDLTSYLTQPMMAPVSGPATTNVLWNSSIHAPVPPYQHPY
ncbi:uncharacterized protein TRUGW13939_04614 [Talaromyces rugulosus]|uniref:Subtelomeric hrmA-associated cluster protein AFUB-079030/YDR124W-like helical bundle domain-containing protein n=1 Tax=Talaromyces rugulosus TaxID=121627 RepID=A0A7H8QU24_TALRU|nr:uncharacterized protein TRUGW13939_04614 [Talaromyces rugulosus]QKX57500.1 hypothetical protein TRUGW13939_04614 [Talaromyces rugulosus]